jgi:hypothetical protein
MDSKTSEIEVNENQTPKIEVPQNQTSEMEVHENKIEIDENNTLHEEENSYLENVKRTLFQTDHVSEIEVHEHQIEVHENQSEVHENKIEIHENETGVSSVDIESSTLVQLHDISENIVDKHCRLVLKRLTSHEINQHQSGIEKKAKKTRSFQGGSHHLTPDSTANKQMAETGQGNFQCRLVLKKLTSHEINQNQSGIGRNAKKTRSFQGGSRHLTPDSIAKNPMPKTGPRKFQCRHCSSMFAYKSLLKIHVGRVHLKIQPFQCKYCQKSFNQKGNMKTHAKTVHKKRKTYKCENCGKSFAQKINMKTHLKNHHKSKKGSKMFRCMQCEYSCGFKALLRHVEKYHKHQLNEDEKGNSKHAS